MVLPVDYYFLQRNIGLAALGAYSGNRVHSYQEVLLRSSVLRHGLRPIIYDESVSDDMHENRKQGCAIPGG